MRLIGYGGMLTESFVGIMALITAAILNQHLYFVMNAPAAQTGTTAQTAAEYVNGLGLSGAPITPEQITQAAEDVGEESIVSRTGGAPTLAIGISEVLHQVFGGESLKAFWYHFAIMFEALFILTTVDAGTRVARFMLSDGLSNLGGPLRKLKDPSWRVGAWICSIIVVAAWGGILLMGVTDPLGGINTLFPLFGIANQLLAAIALTVVTVVVIKRGLLKWAWIPAIPLVVGSDRDDDGVVAEDLLGRSQARVLEATQHLRGREGGGQALPDGEDSCRSRQDRAQHVYSGVAVDTVRGTCGHRGRGRGDRRAADDSRTREPTDGGRTGAVAIVRSVRTHPDEGRTGGAEAMGRAAEVARQIGWYWSTLMGDNHYRRYVDHRGRTHPDEPVLSEREYWRMRHDATESNPNPRCC